MVKDIGFIKLDDIQEPYIHDYCRALGGQWEYVPDDKDLDFIRGIFDKYYDNDCRIIFEEAYSFNKNFVKSYPKLNEEYYFTNKSLNYFSNSLNKAHMNSNNFEIVKFPIIINEVSI